MTDDRRRLRDLTTISEISLRLSSELELDALFDLIVFYGSVLLEAQRAILLSADPETGQLAVARSHGFELGETTESGMLQAARFVSDVIPNNKEYLIVRRWQRSEHPILDQNLAAEAIIVPVPGKDKHLGVLIVEDRLGKEAFSDYDAEVLKLLVAQAGVAIDNARVYQNLDRLVALRTRDLEAERNKSEQLLLNIMPREVCDELKLRGRVTPRRYESATILFTDFVGFTAYSENKDPEDLLYDLEACYSLFDEIVEKYGLEKLKTIGDAYMCAGGLPKPNDTHPIDCVNAALDMVDAIVALHAAREALGQTFWNVRVGVHTGPVVSGVVGSKKFAFDVWGDTVNLASRMESHGVVNRVNVSQATFEATRMAFRFEPRGPIQVKGQGEVNMYLVKERR